MERQVSIVDDDAAFRDSIRMLLESSGYAVQVFASAPSFLSDGNMEGGCVIADIRMPGMSGLELQEELIRRRASIPVIIITGHGDVPIAVRAMRAGAADFIEKPFDNERILESVSRALEAGYHARNRAVEANKARELLALLTQREQEVLDQLVKGHANKVAAHKLGISPRTIEIHRARIMDKLAARNLSDIVRISLSAA
jgi:two-component system, LuxR family, response regulator FixJ